MRLTEPLDPIGTYYQDDEMFQFVITVYAEPFNSAWPDEIALHSAVPTYVYQTPTGPAPTKVGIVRKAIIGAFVDLMKEKNIHVSVSGKAKWCK